MSNHPITSKDMVFFRTAAQLAELSDYGHFPTGCVVVYRGKIISTGCNRNKTDPLQKKYNKYRGVPIDAVHLCHAEVDALKHIKYLDIKWSDVSIYLVRLRKISKYGLAAPCPSCRQLIKDMGIHHIYYTMNSGYAYEYFRGDIK